MDGDEDPRAAAGERRVERGPVDGGVVAQQPLGELRRRRARSAVVLDEAGVDGEPVQREARGQLGRVGAQVALAHLAAALRGRVQHVAEQQRLLARREAQRSGAPQRVDLVLARGEERGDGVDAGVNAGQQRAGSGAPAPCVPASAPASSVASASKAASARVAAAGGDLRRQPEAVTPRGRQVAHADEQRGSGGRTGARQGGCRPAARGVAARTRPRRAGTAFAHVAVQQRFERRADGGVARASAAGVEALRARPHAAAPSAPATPRGRPPRRARAARARRPRRASGLTSVSFSATRPSSRVRPTIARPERSSARCAATLTASTAAAGSAAPGGASETRR